MKIDAIGSVQTIDDIGSKLNPVDSSSAWEEAANSSISPDDDFSTKASQKRADRSVEQIRNEFSKIQSERNEWRNQAAKMNVVQAAKSVPDDEAKITELAKQFDAPVEMVRNYRSLFESRAQELRLSELPKTNPKTADFLSDPNNARIAHDDIDNIMELESLVTNPDGFTIAGDFGEREAGARLAPIDFAVDSVRSLVAGAVGGVVKASGSVSSYLARSLPILGTNAEADLYNPVALTGDEQAARYREAEETGNKIASESGADALYRTGKKWEDAIAGDDIKEYGFASKALLSGMKSLGNMGPAVLASIITKNPSFALTFAGVSEGGESFMEDVLKGKRFAQATAHGIINGGIEVGTEYIPMVRLIKDAAVGTPFIKMFLRNWATETPTEMVATACQTLTDKIADKKDDQNIGDVFLKWLSELPANELETAIAVIPMSLGFSGAARISQIRASEATEKGIKGLNDSAAQSKLRGRAADVYKTLVGSMTKGTPTTHAYIDSEKWTTYFQEQGVDPKAEAEKYGATNYEEAVGTGSFITIPFDEYQSNFSGSEHAPYFTADTKLSEKGMTAHERQEYFQHEDERAKEMDGFLSELGKESENARSVNDVLSELTDEMAIQLESGMDKKTARTQATIAARAFMHPVMRDVVERAKEKVQELTPDEVAGEIRNRFASYGLTINANATPSTINTRKNINPAIDSQLEKLRRGEQPKEKDVYGQSLMEYIRKKGGLRPDDIIRDLVKNKQLPRSIINEKGMGADEFASLQDVLDFGLETEQTQGDNALIDALVNEYTTGEKRYSSAQLNSELLSEAQALNELEKDLQSAGIDINAIDDNAVIREVLSRHYEEQNGKDTRKEPQTSEADRYEQRGFTESEEPSAEERAEANRQYDEVVAKYKDTPLWMKAPNGEPTKLNERQWVQVRTSNFNNWFGDWEKAGIRERLEGQEPVPVEEKYQAGNEKERREIARALNIDFVADTEIGQVVVNGSSIKDSLQHGNTNKKLDVLKNLKDIIETSTFLDAVEDFDGKGHKNYYLATRINRGHSKEIVFFRVRKTAGRDQRLYVHDVFLEDEIKGTPVSALDKTRQGAEGKKSNGHPRGPDLYKSILQDIYSVDNDSVSKVVDSNGEPQVVYHLTDGDFNVFDVSKARQNMDIPAFFFSSGTEDWADMGSRTIGAFLDMKHPKQGKPMVNGEGVKVRNELVDAGYDGTIETEEEMETEYAVFNPNQIKSATSNIGTFSNSPNILYQAEKAPVVTLTGNELGDGADVFEAARNWYKQNLQGTTINRPEIGDIRFTGKGWGKVKSGVKSDELKAKIIPSIKDVISKGEYHGRSELSKDRKDAIVAFHYFTANVTVGNEVVPVGVNVGEDEYGNLFYNINHHPDELVKKKAPILPGEYARGSEPLDTASDVLEQSIGQNSDGVNLFILNEKAGKGVTRGATVINPDRTMRIELFKDANYSTFVHETAHFMLEVYSDMAADANASAYIKGEYATIREYIGAEEEKPITREQHEKFARSFEAYLMEGKAPSPELQGIFSRFKTWLINIYKTLSGLNVKLNKDIREVFDRMMASDEEIAIMHDEASELQPLFTTAEMMGIAQDEFDAYRKIADSELTKAQDQFRQKAMKTKLREKTKGYKEELEQEKKRVEKEYDRDPVVTAFNDLTSDEGFSLNETELQRVYGKAFMSKLPKRNGKRIYSKDGQVSLEDLAENLNFNSGDALIQAIAQLPNRSEYINDKAIANLRDRESDVLNSDTVADEAESALHNEYMEERQRKELTILNRLKRAGKAAKISENKDRIKHRKEAKQIEEDVAAQMDAMKVVSESIIAEKKVKDVKPYLYLRAMQAASRRARKSLKKTNPDYTAAARQKQAEIMNGLLYKEAIRVRQEINKRTLQAKAIARKPLKDALKTRDSLEINKAKYIAALIGIGRKPEVFLERIKTEEKNAGSSDHFDYQVKSTLNELDTATALDVIEDIRAHWDQARRDKVMLVDGKKVEIDEAAEEIADTLSEFGKTGRDKSRDDSASKSLLKAIGNLALYHTRMESFCDMVDGKRVGDGIGPFMRYIFNPVKQAADKARFEQSEYTKKLTEIIDGFGFSRETIEAPELGYTFGKDTGYGKAELIHAILHTGNRSNRERLIVGRKWGSIMNNQLDTRKWNAFMSRMISEGRITEQDFDGVQKIWDLFDKLKPKSQASHKEVFGRYFDEIKASPFFEFGKRYDGGYIPAIYDSKESVAGERQLDPVRDLINEMGAALPKPTAGWGNSRIEGLAHPLLFNMSALRTHINKQILFAYLAPVNKDVSKLLNKKIVRSALKAYDPEFFGKVIEPWLSRAITQNLEASGKKPEPYDSYARTLRTRAGVSIMFANVTNAVEQVFDMTAAFSKVKSHYLTGAFKTMVSDRTATVKAVMDSSPYMRGRMSAEIMAANGRFEQALRPGKLKKLDSWLTDNAYFLQSSVDNFCGPLTWTATYNQATESGLPHNEAVAQADSVVRQVFGANAAEDVSNFEGGTPLKRMFTQFSGYFVQRANLVAGEYSKIQRSDIANKKAAAAILLLQTVLLPAWIGAALRKIVAGSDDDETFASWLMDVFGWGTFNYGLSMGGWAGQAANVAIDYHRGKSFSSGRIFYPPAIKLVEDFFKAFKIFPDTWNGDIDAPKFMKYLSGFENFVPGVPVIPARPVASMKYGYDVMTDKVEPTSGYDFARGTVTGWASADSRG